MKSRLAALTLVALALVACSGPPPPPQAEYDVVAEALKAFDRNDWAQAAPLLREAIVKQPASLRLHYALAIAVSHLDLRDETIREFQWVIANAPATAEAKVAREWLIGAGVRRERATTVAEERPPAPVDREIGNSGLSGRVVWTSGEPPVKTTRMQLFLRGVADTPTGGIQYVRRTDEDGGFQFKNIAAGSYQLSNRIAGEPLWRLRVEIPQGEDVTLELGPRNSLRARDDFPPAGK
jgi:hypothetical protein